jgi:hypothetical protein
MKNCAQEANTFPLTQSHHILVSGLCGGGDASDKSQTRARKTKESFIEKHSIESIDVLMALHIHVHYRRAAQACAVTMEPPGADSTHIVQPSSLRQFIH